jgi:hypothetical protein
MLRRTGSEFGGAKQVFIQQLPFLLRLTLKAMGIELSRGHRSDPPRGKCRRRAARRHADRFWRSGWIFFPQAHGFQPLLILHDSVRDFACQARKIGVK